MLEHLKHLKQTWVMTPVLLVVLAGASYVLYRWMTPPALPAGILYGAGRIEGIDVTVASEVVGRVLESKLVEGTAVRAGDLLVRLDDTDIRTQLARAQAEREAALRQRDRLQRDARTAQHHLETARKDDQRYASLMTDRTIPVQRREQAANALAEAEGRVGSLQEALAEANARIEAADRSVQLARSQLGKTVITAPLTATILTKSIEAGELATPGRAIATLVDLGRVELKVYLPEQDIGKLRLGNEARVRTDAFPNRYTPARVSRMDAQAQFTPRDIHMPDERVRLVFGVTLALDNADGQLKPGMPADAWIRWQPQTSWPTTLVLPR